MEKEYLESLLVENKTLIKLSQVSGKSISVVRGYLKKFGLKTERQNPVKYVCTRCGAEGEDKFYGHKITMCGKCQNDGNQQRYKMLRSRAIDFLGGSCKSCGFDRFNCSLDFHHLDPKQKDPNFRNMRY